MSTICLECGYPITEPICASCVVGQNESWLYGQKINKRIIDCVHDKLKYLLDKIEFEDSASIHPENTWEFITIKCIKCKNDMNLVCFYCVSSRSIDIIRENLEKKEDLESFEESFNLL